MMSVDVENAGDMDAAEIVQVYVKAESSFAPLHPRVCAFERVHLAAGEKKRVEFLLDPDVFMVFDDKGKKFQAESTLPCMLADHSLTGAVKN